MEPFDGNAHAKKLDKEIKDHLSTNRVEGNLAIILVDDDPASKKYVNLKKRVAEKLGIDASVHKYSTKELKSLEILVKGSDILYSPSVKSVVVQLPLPARRLYSLLTKIPYEKDIDMLSEGSKHKYYHGDFSRLPPVVRACEYFLESNNIKIEGKTAFLIGLGELVGKPIEYYLKNKGALVTWTEDYKTGDKITSDLIVTSAGMPKILKGDDISEGCHVIDFGASVEGNKTVGDLDLDSETSHLGHVSPSPGGMGPLVVRFLLMNHLGI